MTDKIRDKTMFNLSHIPIIHITALIGQFSFYGVSPMMARWVSRIGRIIKKNRIALSHHLATLLQFYLLGVYCKKKKTRPKI